MNGNREALLRWQRDWANRILQSVDDEPSALALSFYRQSMQNRLADSLANIYPAVADMAGVGPFNQLADSYRGLYLPSDPDLMLYGEHLGPFLISRGKSLQHLGEIARLEWFLHRCNLECCHPLVPREREPALFLGRASGQAIYLDRLPRLFRSHWVTYEEVTRYHDLPDWTQGDLHRHAWLGIGMIPTDQGPIYWILPAGSYVFLNQLCTGKSLEDALQWGLYADPGGQHQQILESCQRAGLIRVG
ncbi:HvfC/BufC family peptide modification chaperone [Acidithiobacillus caldus]|uniref:HvfC/BufC family peptide modification chaperone n=1 Tax=Acidithiobacillus caldus TaxID=33059 RepID=UPI000A932B4D|nr:putative DNA-binding domain-containing protein [Acidithiobacillus caldus]